MPILAEAKVSIDFGWEHTYEATGQTVSFQMKFFRNALGGIVQLSNEQGVLELPVEIFTEVSDYLIEQGAIKGNLSKMLAPKSGGTVGLPSMQKKAVPGPVVKEEPVQALQSSEVTNTDELLKERLRAKAKAKAEGKIKRNQE